MCLCPEQLPARKKFFKPAFLSGVLSEIVICYVLSYDLYCFMNNKYKTIKRNNQAFYPIFLIIFNLLK